MSDIEARVAAIEERNARVTHDKAWETSWVRRGLIAGVTYLAAASLLLFIGAAQAWLGALVPVIGYLLSTLSLPPAKKMWIGYKEKRDMKNVTIH